MAIRLLCQYEYTNKHRMSHEIKRINNLKGINRNHALTTSQNMNTWREWMVDGIAHWKLSSVDTALPPPPPKPWPPPLPGHDRFGSMLLRRWLGDMDGHWPDGEQRGHAAECLASKCMRSFTVDPCGTCPQWPGRREPCPGHWACAVRPVSRGRSSTRPTGTESPRQSWRHQRWLTSWWALWRDSAEILPSLMWDKPNGQMKCLFLETSVGKVTLQM